MTSTQSKPQTNLGFGFVQSLAGELSSGKIDLPSFPEVATRIRQLLNDPQAAVDQVVRLVGSEPALAARLMLVANASSFNRTGKQITDLRTAINRIGHSMVRSAAMAFALSQLRRGAKLDKLQARLNKLWQRSTQIAALAYVLARTCSTVNPDEALLAGMMHGIGKLYIMTRAAQHPQLFTDHETLDEILGDWHASIGKAILENWEFPESMSSAVGEQDDHGREDEETDQPDLRDIVAIAILMSAYSTDISNLELALNGLPAARRLGLDQTRIRTVMQECAAEVSALSAALGS
jgi:HD-like signal output (HDOD) protein